MIRGSAELILDELLVIQAQDGEAAALDELVRRWQPRLLRHAWHLTRLPDAAADVTQEAWLAIVRGLRRLRDPAGFRAWAYQIVTHKCADWTRQRQRDRTRSATVADVVQPPAASLNDEEATQLHEAIARLGIDQRAILSLRYWEQMTQGEIARVLNVPEGTVKSRLHQAREELRAFLKGEAHD